jgi:hypothetical protein
MSRYSLGVVTAVLCGECFYVLEDGATMWREYARDMEPCRAAEYREH